MSKRETISEFKTSAKQNLNEVTDEFKNLMPVTTLEEFELNILIEKEINFKNMVSKCITRFMFLNNKLIKASYGCKINLQN